MHISDINNLMKLIAELWPQAGEKWTPAVQGAFIDQLGSLKIEFKQAAAVVKSIRVNYSRYLDPDTVTILKAFREVNRDRTVSGDKQPDHHYWRAAMEKHGHHGLSDREVVERHYWDAYASGRNFTGSYDRATNAGAKGLIERAWRDEVDRYCADHRIGAQNES